MTPPRDQQSEQARREGYQFCEEHQQEYRQYCSGCALTAHDEARDWKEDSGHENGKYTNTCAICGHTFVGHKRRVACKLCSKHDEALPGEWTMVPVNADKPEGMCFIRTREGGKLRFYLRYEQAVAVAAAHNSAQRVLVDALRPALDGYGLLIKILSDLGVFTDVDWEQDEHIKAHKKGVKALQPYSGQKEGANGN